MMNRREAIKISFQHVVYAGLFGTMGNAIFACTKEGESDSKEIVLKILGPNQAEILSILADLIIPPSDTPGALDVGVIPAIDQYLEHFLVPQNQAVILGGLDRVDLLSQQLYSAPLKELSANDQSAVLQFLSNDASKSADKSSHLFFLIREMVVRAYFQSETVAKTVLKYDPIPGNYQACVPLKEVGGQWSL